MGSLKEKRSAHCLPRGNDGEDCGRCNRHERNKEMKYYLIDYENVNASGLDGIEKLSQESRVVIFYTRNSNKIDLNMLNILLNMETDLTVVEVHHGKQALDIQLASYVGFLIGTEGPGSEYNIISKDKGYRNIQDFWSDHAINLFSSIRQAARQKASKEGGKKAPVRGKGNAAGEGSAGKSSGQKDQTALKKTDSEGGQKKNSSESGQKKASDRRNEVNTDIQKILSKAGCPGDLINGTASFVSRNIGQDGYKQIIYRGIISELGQKTGLEVYRLIKDVL